MKLYTEKVIAQWLNVTDRRVRQLKQQGILTEVQPGLYDLRSSVSSYIDYLRGSQGIRDDLNIEKAKATRARRELVELEVRKRRGELHETEQIETALSTIILNFRTKMLALPAKLSPPIAAAGSNQNEIFEIIHNAVNETLEELSNYDIALGDTGEDDGSETMS